MRISATLPGREAREGLALAQLANGGDALELRGARMRLAGFPLVDRQRGRA